MAVSGTTTFTYTRDQVIAFAMRKLGILELGVTPDATSIANFNESLNLLLKSWITKGVKIWTLQELTLPLVAGQTTYNIGPVGSAPGTVHLIADKPMKLIQAWLRNTSVTPQNDIPLQVISQHNYNEFGSKFSTGTSNSVQMFVGREQATVNVYLTPDATAAGMYQLHMLTQRTLYDAGTAASTLDIPAEWMYALGWNLALDGILDYGVSAERAQMIAAGATKFLAEAEDYDSEYNSIYFTPDSRGQAR